MKLNLTRSLFLATLFTSAAVCAGQNAGGNIFNANEYNLSIFGESANGNVDSEPKTNVVTTTTTTTTSTIVAAPTPTPPPPPPQSIAKAVKPAAKALLAAGSADPSVTKTSRSRRILTHDRLEHNAGGAGIAFNYFFTRFIGVGVESDFLAGNPYNTAVTGNLIFRYPFEFGAQTVTSGYAKDGKDGKTTVLGPTWGLAPYILIGGGGQWDGRGEGIGEAGGGVEFRFKQHYGIFVEGRWIIHDARESYAAETAGFSYTF